MDFRKSILQKIRVIDVAGDCGTYKSFFRAGRGFEKYLASVE
jgi:hypothetical protein